MPLKVVKVVGEEEKPQCDIEIMDVHGDHFFTTSDDGKLKVKQQRQMLLEVCRLNFTTC